MSMQVNGGGLYVSQIAQYYGVYTDSLVAANPELNLNSYRVRGEALPEGTLVVIPSSITGGLDSHEGNYYQTAYMGSQYHTLSDTYTGSGCYYILYTDEGRIQTWNLPTYPNEFSDNNNVTFSATDILGRSVAYQTYNSSSRSVSFTLQLHEELVPYNYDYIHELVAAIQSACYPDYQEGIVHPPQVQFVIGNHFDIKGILTQCGASWKAPIIDGRLVNCDLSLGITETTGPYSMSQVRHMGGLRGV